VCDARLDDEATYDTRDEITRQLIARVFRDGKELLRMARAHVEGAKERLAEYRRAKLEYLIQRAEEIEAARREAEAALTGTGAVTVISRFSAVSRERDAERPIELTANVVAEILDADPSADPAPLCVVSAPKRAPNPRGGHRNDSITWQEIADRLGISKTALDRYRHGVNPWPVDVKERFEKYERLRHAARTEEIQLPDDEPTTAKRRLRSDGEFSWANIAATLGMSVTSLERCRAGKRPWPNGTKERFDELVRRRTND
jgi:hypothetical protein